jgi:hypothetical protein
MANKKTVNVLSTWADASGGEKTFTFSVERSLSGNNLDLSAITTKAQAAIAAIEGLSDAKFVSASIEVPIAAQISGGKENADADSRARRRAIARFDCEAGENLRYEQVEVSVPDPKDATITTTEGKQSLKTDDSDFETFRDAMIAKALAVSGEQVTGYAGSRIVQQPA